MPNPIDHPAWTSHAPWSWEAVDAGTEDGAWAAAGVLVGAVRKVLPLTRGVGWTELGAPSEPRPWAPWSRPAQGGVLASGQRAVEGETRP